MFYNPFVGNSRMQFMQPQQQQNNFSGWNDRLTKIEEGIASLTDQFKNFQNPGNEPFKQVTGPSIRQPGDMGKYVADNDPVTPGNPPALGGTPPQQGPFDLANSTPNPLFNISNANFNVSPPGTLKLDPQATMDTLGPQLLNPLEDPFSNITAPGQIPERYRQGFEDFYNQNPDDYMRMGGQAVSYVNTPQGETIRFGDTGGATNFRKYLESIGETPKADTGFLSTNIKPLQQGIMGLANYQSQQNTGPGI